MGSGRYILEGNPERGGIQSDSSNIKLVKKLASRGIVSAVCTKNEVETVQHELKRLGMWDYFVFNSINWDPKGPRVRTLISDMRIRPVNVLFIDDNHLNLKEVEHFCPGIMTALPGECLEELKNRADTIGKDDQGLSRLQQYKILERKRKERLEANDNSSFLKGCDIRVSVHHECLIQLDRICELVMRTNQLNYTKKRSSKEDLDQMIKDPSYECATVTARDKFGEYGIIGFYALRKDSNTLIHYLFSCRTMGMGIEQYIYAYLGFPVITIAGDVAIPLIVGEKPDWISLIDETVQEQEKSHEKEYVENMAKVLFKGPCDTESSLAFIQGNKNKFDREFTFVADNGLVVSAQNTTYHALESLSITERDKEKYRSCNPFWDEKLYETRMFHGKYDVVFFSLFKEAISGLYQDKENRVKFVHDDWFYNATDPNAWERYTNDKLTKISVTQMETFADVFQYMGRIPQEDIVQNLRVIRQKLDKKCLLVISVPTTYPYYDTKDSRKNDRAEYNRVLLDILNEEFLNQHNVRIIDYTKYANTDWAFLDSSNHFTKKVYYEVSQEYKRLIEEWCGEQIRVENKGKGSVILFSIYDAIKSYFRKNSTLVKLIRKARNKF